MLDKDYFPSASTFGAFRFSKLRSRPGEELKHQFISTSNTNLVFGHGKDACPGESPVPGRGVLLIEG
jgi:hypothetical protein